MKSIKNLFFTGLIALAAVITFGGCKDPTGVVPESVTYSGTTAAGETYTLVIYEDLSRAAYAPQAGDRYELTIFPGSKRSVGTVTNTAGATLTLMPSAEGAPSFTVTTSATGSGGGQITAIIGTVTLEGGETISGSDILIQGSGGTPTPGTIQLAADINAIKAGSAAVNGAAVKITGGPVDFRTNITVPAGVTLDVTEDGAAVLLHDVTLTVNGTVNANSKSIRLEDTGRWAVINGNGIINLKNKGHLLQVSGNSNVTNPELTLDGVTLAGLKDNDDHPLVNVGGGGKLVLKSGLITGNGVTGSGGGVMVWENGTFTMEGGAISGNTANYAGGVHVWQGIFTLEGGTISGNTANDDAGGVFIGENATFIMTGGTISGNTAKDDGGGVQVPRGTFTMKGGEISGNTVLSNASSSGGGVSVWQGIFTQEGGTRIGNRTASGGGVKVWDGTFIMTGGTISGNTATEWGGGGVSVGRNATFTMEDGTISGNTANSAGGGVEVGGENAIFTMKNGTINGNTVIEYNGGGVSVGENGAFTMEGGTISGNTANGTAGGVGISGGNATFTMEDGAISGNEAADGGGVSVGGNGTFTMENGTISGNTAENDGGGVMIYDGTFTMKNGVINGNIATGHTGSSGGGVQVGGIFTMEGGTISGNTANNAGGVEVGGNGTFTMENGTISGNTADNGGGVWVLNGTFIKKNGTIYGDTDTTHSPGSNENTASGSGHAVFTDDKIRNATADSTVNLYAHYDGSTWTYNGASAGVGDTTSNWE
jgi:hypothetical protein